MEAARRATLLQTCSAVARLSRLSYQGQGCPRGCGPSSCIARFHRVAAPLTGSPHPDRHVYGQRSLGGTHPRHVETATGRRYLTFADVPSPSLFESCQGPPGLLAIDFSLGLGGSCRSGAGHDKQAQSRLASWIRLSYWLERSLEEVAQGSWGTYRQRLDKT